MIRRKNFGRCVTYAVHIPIFHQREEMIGRDHPHVKYCEDVEC